jgi:hypothetical protein
MNTRHIGDEGTASPSSRRRDLVAIVFLAATLLVPWVVVNLLQSPSPFYRDYDPEIQYFMNSLLVFKGQPYYYMDHPGTPVELIGSLLLALTYPFTASTDGGFVYFQLQHPNLFLSLARLFLTISSIGCAILIYRTLARERATLTDVLLGVAIPLMFYLAHREAFATLTLWSHTSFSFPFGALLLVILFRIARRNTRLSARDSAILGLLLGVLASVVIYFAAWTIGFIVFVAVWYRLARWPWGELLRVLAISVAAWVIGFGLMLLPGITRVTYLWDWLNALAFHQGIYGAGPSGLTSVPFLLGGFQTLSSVSPKLLLLLALPAVLFACLVVWTGKALGQESGLWGLGVGLLTMITIVLFLAMKQPKYRYLLPAAAAVPVLVMVILEVAPPGHWLRHVLMWSVVLATAAYLPMSLWRYVNDQNGKMDHIRDAGRQQQQAISDYRTLRHKQADDMMVLWTYGVYSPCYALQFGNEYTGFDFSSELSSICPNQYEFNIWAQEANVGGHWRSIEELEWDLILTSRTFLRRYPYLADYGVVVEYPDDVVAIHPK